jgi:hypothetical protein
VLPTQQPTVPLACVHVVGTTLPLLDDDELLEDALLDDDDAPLEDAALLDDDALLADDDAPLEDDALLADDALLVDDALLAELLEEAPLGEPP